MVEVAERALQTLDADASDATIDRYVERYELFRKMLRTTDPVEHNQLRRQLDLQGPL